MPDILQHILVLALVAGCCAWVLRGVVRTIRQRRGGIGKCCEKGCEPKADTPRTVFMPAENLRLKRK